MTEATREQLALLEGVFPGMSTAVLSELGTLVRECTYPSGTVLCHEGQAETTFYIVKAGHVAVTKHLEGEVSRTLNDHGPGEFFGEIALIQNSRRIATVRTTEPTTVLELDKQSFDDFLNRSPAVGLALIRQVAARLRHSDQAAIEELRKMNQELAAAYNYLEEQERLRSEFLTTVAHELRTPLTVAKGYLQLLRSGAIPGSGSGEAVETVYRHVDKVVHLVNNILFMQEMALIDLDFEVISIGEIVSRVVEMNRARAGSAGVQLCIACAIMPPLIRGDVEGLVTGIGALVDNAIKYSPAGGQVVLRLALDPDPQYVALSIEDQGPGISIEQQTRIFERFKGDVPGAPTTRGLGLGLPIARYLIEKHGGRIWVRSTVGKGSTFTITLPVHTA